MVVDIIKQDKQTNMLIEELIIIILSISLEILFVCNNKNKFRKVTRFGFFKKIYVLIFTEKTLQMRKTFKLIFSYFQFLLADRSLVNTISFNEQKSSSLMALGRQIMRAKLVK